MASTAFTRKTNSNGTVNHKYVDLLEEDKAISGQKFVCVSFVSPENVLMQKKDYFFSEFLKHYDFSKSVKKFHQYLNFISFKYNIKMDELMSDFEEYVKNLRACFKKVFKIKPDSSRSRSSEIFLLGYEYCGT